VRLTTLAITMPTLYWPEVLTHRKFSRNASSDRALPAGARIEQVREDPFIPVVFYAESRGMVPREPLGDQELARRRWLEERDEALIWATSQLLDGWHHEHINRLLTPWLWTTAIISSTEWENFFKLRLAPDAAEAIRTVAGLMRDAMDASTPVELQPGQWHLPFIDADEKGGLPLNISVARCARVSYLNHDGKVDVDRDLTLAKRLREEQHWSVFEHQATPQPEQRSSPSNFDWPWLQHRKILGG
jgi:hypothetical protein